MKRISFRRQLLFFLVLDLLFVLAAGAAILVISRIFKTGTPDVAELSLVDREAGEKVDVVLLEVSRQYEWVTLNKIGTLWLGEDSSSPEKTLWPCDNDKVAAFIAEVSKTLQASKKADGVSSWRNLGLEERECFKVKVRQEGGQPVTWRFSADTAAQADRLVIFRTPRGQTVWEAKSSIGGFLTCTADFWADPYAAPAFASGGGGGERGELFCLLPASHLKPVAVHEVSFGDVEACFTVYKKEDGYVVRPSFTCQNTPELSLINYGYLLDEAALSRLLEEIAR